MGTADFVVEKGGGGLVGHPHLLPPLWCPGPAYHLGLSGTHNLNG